MEPLKPYQTMCCVKHPAPQSPFDWKSYTKGTAGHPIKSAEHLDETELNKLLKYLSRNELWTYYLLVRVGVATALRFSDLSRITWGDVLKKSQLHIREQKTGKMREIPISQELSETLSSLYLKLKQPPLDSVLIPLHIRTVNKQIKVHAAKSGIRNKRISTHTWRKTFGREVWKRNNFSEASLIKLSLLFNHSSTAVTRIYLDITREEVGNLYEIDDIFVH